MKFLYTAFSVVFGAFIVIDLGRGRAPRPIDWLVFSLMVVMTAFTWRKAIMKRPERLVWGTVLGLMSGAMFESLHLSGVQLRQMLVSTVPILLVLTLIVYWSNKRRPDRRS